MPGKYLRTSFISAALIVAAGVAQAADPATPAPAAAPDFDVLFGGKGMTDYNFRGISQSNRNFGFQAYIEPHYQWLYAGVAGWSTKLPTDPTGEFDLYGGIRPVFGNLTFDFGATYYYYGRERQLFFQGAAVTPAHTSFWEPYAKVSYDFDKKAQLGFNVYYAPNWLNSGAYGTYASATLSIALPSDFSVSGEFGHYFFGRTDAFLGGAQVPEYNYWNVGLTYTYKDTLKFDVRYHQTDLNKVNCQLATTDPSGLVTGRSSWCGAAVVGTVSFDTSFSALKLLQ